MAKEVLGYANMDKVEAHKKKDLTNSEMKETANKLQLLRGNLESIEEKY